MIKTGLVLGGGGSRGAYQIGVWRALREFNIKIDVVTGTSIGALNGALMVQDDFEGAVKLWEGMDYDKVMSDIDPKFFDTYKGAGQTFFNFIKKIVSEGGMDIAPLENTVRSMLDEEKVRSSPIQYGLVTVEYPTMKEVALSKYDVPEGKMADYLLASAACYPAFKSRSIDDTLYVDGGYRNNLPIDLAVELGANEVIAVDLEDDCEYAPSSYKNIPIRYIKSYWDLGIFLSFNKDLLARNTILGYLDVLKSYRVVDGTAYAFKKGSKEELYEKIKPCFKIYNEIIGMTFDENQGPVDKVVRGKLIRALSFNPKSNINIKEYLIRAAELAGEIMGLPPTVIYDLSSFNKEIIKRYREHESEFFKDLEINLKDPKNLAKTTKALEKYEKREIMEFIYRNISKLFYENAKVNVKIMASIAPKEFLAALYIFYIKNANTLTEYAKIM